LYNQHLQQAQHKYLAQKPSINWLMDKKIAILAQVSWGTALALLAAEMVANAIMGHNPDHMALLPRPSKQTLFTDYLFL